jgi:hypothetical protein
MAPARNPNTKRQTEVFHVTNADSTDKTIQKGHTAHIHNVYDSPLYNNKHLNVRYYHYYLSSWNYHLFTMTDNKTKNSTKTTRYKDPHFVKHRPAFFELNNATRARSTPRY